MPWLMGTGGGDRALGDDPRPPIPPPPAWLRHAACLGMPTEWWFPERGQQPTRGLEVCERCPVRVECGQWAIAEGFDDGTFGGMTARARRPLLEHKFNPSPTTGGAESPWCACGCGTPLPPDARRPTLPACKKREERLRKRLAA